MNEKSEQMKLIGNKMKIERFFGIATVLFLMNISLSISAITVQFRNFSIDELPYLSAEIKAQQNGTNIDLSKDEIVIIDERFTETASSVENLQDGWQKVKWEFNREFMNNENNSFFIIVSRDGESGQVARSYPAINKPLLTVYNNKSGSYLNEVGFHDKNIFQVLVRAQGKINDMGYEDPVQIDSITFSSPYFKYNWQGNEFDLHSRPPMKMQSARNYLVDILFNPPDNKAYRAIMTLHYEKGLKKNIVLYGGNFSIPRVTNIQLLSPNGSEILAPCQDFDIRWKGHSKADEVIVEFSPDSGLNWTEITRVKDSVFRWNVPYWITNKALIRVRQDYTKKEERTFIGDGSQVQAVNFNNTGARVLSATSNGIVTEWDVFTDVSPKPLKKYFLNESGATDQNYLITDVEYTKDNQEFAVMYFDYESLRTTIKYFKIGEDSPIFKFEFPQGENPKNMLANPKKEFFAIVPRLGANIKIFSIADKKIIGTVKFKNAVSAFSFHKNSTKAVVALYSNEVLIIDLANYPNHTVVKEYKRSDIPAIQKINISPNGELLAFSSMKGEGATNLESYVFEISREEVVRTYKPAALPALAVEFSPASTSVVIGSPGQQQLALYDLSSGTELLMSGHINTLSAFKMAPEGYSILTGSHGPGNLRIRNFTYPEFDASDANFNISEPKLTISKPLIEPAIIGTDNYYTFTTNVCNNGEVPVYFNNVKFKWGAHLKVTNILIPDTLYPNQCKTLNFNVHPLDTGNLSDTLLFATCNNEFKVPVNIRGLNRKLYIFNNTLDFGDICSNQISEKEFEVFRNDDTVDVLINTLSIDDALNSKFTVLNEFQDTIIKPNQVLKIKLRFTPDKLGPFTGKMNIIHSNQIKVYPTLKLKGTGIGTFLELSHDKLPFVDEIPKRILKLKNTGVTPLVISNINTNPEGFYKCNSNLPVQVLPGATIELEIERLSIANKPINLNIEATPCLVNGLIVIDNYAGSSVISIPEVNVDARDKAEIKVNYKNYENIPYKGERFLETEFTIHKGIFLPLESVSEYGKSTITRNEVVGNKRYIRVKTEGDFPIEGTAFVLKGVAGLTDVNSSDIEFTHVPEYWGKNVQTSKINSKFNIINVSPGRNILSNTSLVRIISISPNPATSLIEVIIESDEEKTVVIEVFDFLGNKLMNTNPINLKIGKNNLTLNIQYLNNGSYNLVIRDNGAVSSKQIIIAK